MNIGIVGGSFNPIHIAHLIIADRFVDQMELDVCYFVPAYQSPFKQGDSSLASAEDRLAMVKDATQQHDKFRVSDVEIQRGGVSYTIDTIRYFAEQHPGANISFLIGSDQAVEFVRWNQWDDILSTKRSCALCVDRSFLRQRWNERITETLSVDGRAPKSGSIHRFSRSPRQISDVALEEGKSINYLTVKSVRDHIAEHGLYQIMAINSSEDPVAPGVDAGC